MATAVNPRRFIMDFLKTNLPSGWKVLSGDVTPSGVYGPTVLVYTNRQQRVPDSLSVTADVSVVLICQYQVDHLDPLDDYLDTLTETLDNDGTALWREANFRVWNETYPAYEVTVDVAFRKDF